MKIKQIYIYSMIIMSVFAIQDSYASSEKSSTDSVAHTAHQHPPHDHHQTDHIKKLDESMRRKREDE